MKAPKLRLDDLELGIELLGQFLGEIGIDALDLAGLGIAVGDRVVERELADAQLLGSSSSRTAATASAAPSAGEARCGDSKHGRVKQECAQIGFHP